MHTKIGERRFSLAAPHPDGNCFEKQESDAESMCRRKQGSISSYGGKVESVRLDQVMRLKQGLSSQVGSGAQQGRLNQVLRFCGRG